MNNYQAVETQEQPQHYSQAPNQYERIIQEEKVGNFISLTSPYKTLQKIDFILKGFVFDEGKREWVKVSEGIPDDIRMDYLKALTPHLTEDVRMTRLDMNTINNIMEFVIEWSIDYLDIVADEKKLTEERMTNIHLIICSAVFYTLSRSHNGVERDMIYKTLKMGDDFSNYAKQEEKKSFLSSIMPWK